MEAQSSSVDQPTLIPEFNNNAELHDRYIYALASTSSSIISSGKGGSIQMWSKSTLQPLCNPLSYHQGTVTALGVSETAGLVFSGDTKGHLAVWSLASGQLIQGIAQAHDDTVLKLAVSGDGEYILSTSRDRSVKVWHRNAGASDRRIEFELKAELAGHQGAVLSALVTSDCKRAVSISGDKVLKIWNLETSQTEKTFRLASGVGKLQFIEGERKMLAACSDSRVRIYSLENGEEEACLNGHTNVVKAAHMIPGINTRASGETIISASYDGTVRMWKRGGEGQGKWRTVRILSFKHAIGEPDFNPQSGRIFDMVVDEKEEYVYACGQSSRIVRWHL
ncbi:WD40 repeat-like protein [Trematosphaeria pertusa]|uniref:Mitochondrial division protein 1 n=1 Tax=Trematosphaeria pertusa TaxID=390896 RepID=A0A6A6HW19_9PLEO|nr:WD40 repeat-like protein [Trematosphaeria pertusa]KAF2242394.1 WD40 repeat-like protein [Trematosphaeria pertusa]